MPDDDRLSYDEDDADDILYPMEVAELVADELRVSVGSYYNHHKDMLQPFFEERGSDQRSALKGEVMEYIRRCKYEGKDAAHEWAQIEALD
jgi:hypothetical protein